MSNINMLQMVLNGSFLIAVIICFRHFFFHQIPKRFFVFLWICAIARLLFPFSISVWMQTDARSSGRVVHASNRKTGIKLSDYDYREISKTIRIID